MAVSGLVEQHARRALADSFDVCDGCRRCVEHCVTFPTLFELLDRMPAAPGDGRAAQMTPDQQDRVAVTCFHCGVCVDTCTFDVDVPHVVRDVMAVRASAGVRPLSEALAARLLARSPRLVARLMGGRAGTWRRRVLGTLTGLSARRTVPRLARRRCSRDLPADDGTASAVIVPTCVVEHQRPDVGLGVAAALTEHEVTCALGSKRCCGAAALHAGDRDRFESMMSGLLTDLAPAARRGADIVVAQPVCAHTIRTAPTVLDHPDAEVVAARVRDAVEYVAARAGIEPPPLAPAVGIGGTWGLRRGHDAVVEVHATRVAARVTATDTSSCDDVLDAAELAARLGRHVDHPFAVHSRPPDG